MEQDCSIVWLTGHSQAQTTLLLSLLDGHFDLLVYPDQPSFRRLFERLDSYKNARHIIADFLFGTLNPIHYAREVRIAQDFKSKDKAAVHIPDKNFFEIITPHLN